MIEQDQVPESNPTPVVNPAEDLAGKDLTKKVVKEKKPKKKPVKKRPAKKKAAKRKLRPFPATSFEEAMALANSIQLHAGGQEVRKTTLFEKLDQAPDSGTSRQLITNSSRYGLTLGSYKAEFLKLTDDGVTATSEDSSPKARIRARFKLAIVQIDAFNQLYEENKNKKLPSKEFLVDKLKDFGVPDEYAEEGVDTFIVNATFLGLLKTIGGSERLVTIEHVAEELAEEPDSGNADRRIPANVDPSAQIYESDSSKQSAGDFKKICFYITPIGGEESEERRHSDFFLEHIIKPAVEKEFELDVIRADHIGKAGMIGKQILEHILHSRLVIADLSFHNPNVYYELCLRHVSRLPTVQIIRASDAIPFDLEQSRTIKIDTEDVYGLYPKIQTHRSQLATLVRRALEAGDAADNPISVYYPGAKLDWARRKN